MPKSERMRMAMSVLIAPLWNWNQDDVQEHHPWLCSNRTFMELKLREQRISVLTMILVLIAPLWNWNSSFPSVRMSPWGVLIAPLWNWNATWRARRRNGSSCSNRTFMELKFTLIPSISLPIPSSNRTFMELKSRNLLPWSLVEPRSNRTFMELKSRM